MAELKLALVISALDRATRPLQRIGRQMNELGRRTNQLGRNVTGLGTGAFTRLTLPIVALGAGALGAFGNIEQMQVAFEGLTGSAALGEATIRGLLDFTAKTPFQLQGVGNAGRQLLAVGVNVKELEGELLVIGDIRGRRTGRDRRDRRDLRQGNGEGKGPDRGAEPADGAGHPPYWTP